MLHMCIAEPDESIARNALDASHKLVFTFLHVANRKSTSAAFSMLVLFSPLLKKTELSEENKRFSRV